MIVFLSSLGVGVNSVYKDYTTLACSLGRGVTLTSAAGTAAGVIAQIETKAAEERFKLLVNGEYRWVVGN